MSEMVLTQQMLIDGQWVDSLDGNWISVENPSTKTIFAKVPRANGFS
jgi:acyl-CoA reductase-like NAD-dependent aldehyde dehydrogenase